MEAHQKNSKDVAKVDYEKYEDKKEDALRPMRKKGDHDISEETLANKQGC